VLTPSLDPEMPRIAAIPVKPEFCGRDGFIGARQMLFDSADADADIRGDPALGFAIDPEAAEDGAGPVRQSVEHALQQRELLAGDEMRLDRWLFVDFPLLPAMRVDPILLAPHPPPRRAAPPEEMVVRHAIEIGARLGDGADTLCQELEMHLLENVVGLVRGRSTQREIARQCGASLGEGPNQTATGETLPIALVVRHAALLAPEQTANNPLPRA